MDVNDLTDQEQSSPTIGYEARDLGSETDENTSQALWSESSPGLQSATLPPYIRDLERGRVTADPLTNSIRPRPPQQRRTASASHVVGHSSTDHTSPTTTFESPLRSIFATGPPTASVSVNTALASISATPSSSSGPFAALTTAGGSSRRFLPKSSDIHSGPVIQTNRPNVLNLEKDVDDPNNNGLLSPTDGRSHNTSTALSRLFGASEGSSPAPPPRGLSHLRTLSNAGRTLNDTSTLTGHLFHHGFVEGKHSDISVYAFGETYRLHKLLLDRVPFFSSAFSGSWAESSAAGMVLHPEDIDINITRAAFELAIKRIYGTQFPVQEDQEAIGLFATACWLDMPELVDSCVESILRQMQTSTLHGLIKLVTSNYYGKAGDRILSSAKAMLCREGWEMPYECWDKIPADIIREIIGGDPFFVPSEWERWFLAVKILNRRLKARAVEKELITSNGQFLYSKPSSLRYSAVRYGSTYHRETGLGRLGYVAEKDEPWISLYRSPEISPLLVLLDEGIHYVHLRFEQLQQIRTHKDIFGVPILPEKVISDALWMSMELRQRVLNAHENDLELGITETAERQEDEEDGDGDGEHSVKTVSESAKGKQRQGSIQESLISQEMEPQSWDGNGQPRKFWIPSNDVSCVMGGTREANMAGSATVGSEWITHAARLSTNLDAVEAVWTSDMILDPGRPLSQNISSLTSPRFSHFPPFRFSAEFPTPRSLKEKKRVYSQTVWYAGSMWNLYIQRVNTSKSQQLGIYLHRAKDSSPSDDPLAQVVPATVDDRIGQLEREMLLRKTERRNRQWRTETSGSSGENEDDSAGISSGYGNKSAGTNIAERSILDIPSTSQKDDDSDRTMKTFKSPDYVRTSMKSPPSGSARLLDSDEEDEELLRLNRRYNVPAMPPYLDGRPVIKTYFKIYSPDKAGRLLSIYESAPEKFVVSKSWGWKSSQIVFEDGNNAYDMARGVKDGKLRYMVVIGNV